MFTWLKSTVKRVTLPITCFEDHGIKENIMLNKQSLTGFFKYWWFCSICIREMLFIAIFDLIILCWLQREILNWDLSNFLKYTVFDYRFLKSNKDLVWLLQLWHLLIILLLSVLNSTGTLKKWIFGQLVVLYNNYVL